MSRLILFLMTGFLLISGACGNKSTLPKGILPPDKMQEVYLDFVSADVFANEFLIKDSGKNVQAENARLQQQIFNTHKVSRETFYKSYNYYVDHQQLMKDMLDSILVKQQRIAEKRLQRKLMEDSARNKKVLPI